MPIVILVLGLVLLLGAHMVPTRPALRGQLVGRFGQTGYAGLFAIASLGGLVLVVWGYGAARSAGLTGSLMLYDPPAWTRHLVALLMIPVFPLLAATGSTSRIRTVVKHPMLVAVKLWAVAHLIANGSVPDVILFGSVLAWAVVDRISVKRRGAQTPPAVAGWTQRDTIAVVVGLALYLAFVFRLHLWLIGVSPV